MKELFITATDTDAGKTFVSCAIIHALSLEMNANSTQKLKIAAFKPVAAGCDLVDGQLINEDAKMLCEFSNAQQSIQQINPIAFKDPIAPHIAAQNENTSLSIVEITQYYQQVKALNADVILVEGAGGWRLPLGPLPIDEVVNEVIGELSSKQLLDEKNLIDGNSNTNTYKKADNNISYQFLSDFVQQSKLDVILIVNMKLGCLNHALLTFETIKNDGLNCIAWIANSASSEPMNNLSENIQTLEQLLPMPKIAQFDFIADVNEAGNTVTFQEKIQQAARQINLAPLVP